MCGPFIIGFPKTLIANTLRVIQNIYIFEVIAGKNGPELKVLDTIKGVQAPGKECNL